MRQSDEEVKEEIKLEIEEAEGKVLKARQQKHIREFVLHRKSVSYLKASLNCDHDWVPDISVPSYADRCSKCRYSRFEKWELE